MPSCQGCHDQDVDTHNRHVCLFRAYNLSFIDMLVRPSRLSETPRLPSFELLDMLRLILGRM